jgi:predicted acetyltransferase
VRIEVVVAALRDRPALERLFQLYLHDFTEFDPHDVGDDGLYAVPSLDAYWSDPGRFPFLIRVEGSLAGFVLVSPHSPSGRGADRSIAEFFVMRMHRRSDVGRTAATMVFNLLPGTWEVAQIVANTPAQAFWRAVIGAYTGGAYEELPRGSPSWDGPIQRFRSLG